MSKQKVTVENGRVTIECETCRVSMTVDESSAFGARMVANWPTAHKCVSDKRKS